MNSQYQNPNEQNGQNQQQQQPYNGQAQQPYSPQQPYCGQQANYGQQPVQQVYVVSGKRPATEGEKNGLWATAGSWLMLILCIVSTINVVVSIFTGGLFGIFKNILPLLMVIGYWISFVAAKGKKLKASGAKLIKVPFTINFVFTMIGYILAMIVVAIGLVGGIVALESTGPTVLIIFAVALILLVVIISFYSRYYKSLIDCIKNAIAINQGYGVENRSGTFAATVMFIMASLEFLPSLALGILSIAGQALLASLVETIGMDFLSSVFDMLLAGGIMSLVTGLITFGYKIIGGVLILKFIKSTKNGGVM